MTELRARMIRTMQLHRLADKTQQVYLWHVTKLAQFYNQPPDRLTAEQIQAFVHHLLTERQLAWSTCNQAMAAFAFLYKKALNWSDLRLQLPPRKRKKMLPRIWDREALEHLFTATRPLKYRTMLMTAYAGGLRVSEVVNLQTRDLDSARMRIRVRQGKGCKDRETLLSARLLHELRDYWRMYRLNTPGDWLFCGRNPQRPLGTSSVQKAYNQACQRIGHDNLEGTHSLRHSFCTHLLEAGVDVRLIQWLMGHGSLITTSGYLQLTHQRTQGVVSPLDLLPDPNRRQVD